MNKIDLSRLDLNLLVLFETVFETGHVGRAAERLHLTPSAVSHGLGRLRQLLNDPLFLKTPRGMVATARANELAPPIADVLARARRVIASAEPFEMATSSRRFTIGAPDGVSAVFLHPLLAALQAQAPGVDVGIRQLLPAQGETSIERAWRSTFAELEARAIDVAVVPTDAIPPRFHSRLLYEEEFVVAVRTGHPYAKSPTLERYCAARHLVVSMGGDPHGFVDELLARQGASRRVALTVPNFMFAMAVVATSDLLAALPRRLVQMHGERFGVAAVKAPLPLGRFQLHAVAPQAALHDDGVAWILDRLEVALQPEPARRSGKRGKRTA
ncbi:LysR family transcriptional regulator [Arenimonas sp.]|uniref:LysR family transcriptional regulator n=1 Tax=Arenimonas sp. TaxID=1872635 RepID=UPI0039E22FB1